MQAWSTRPKTEKGTWHGDCLSELHGVLGTQINWWAGAKIEKLGQ
jgi:hypothetical protein